MEEVFPLTVDEADIAPENFETINLIEAFVTRKVGLEEPVSPPLPVPTGETGLCLILPLAINPKI